MLYYHYTCFCYYIDTTAAEVSSSCHKHDFFCWICNRYNKNKHLLSVALDLFTPDGPSIASAVYLFGFVPFLTTDRVREVGNIYMTVPSLIVAFSSMTVIPERT